MASPAVSKMPPLQIPSTAPMSGGPKSAAALDFEALTWRDAVNNFRMQSDHKAQRLEEFLKSYTTPQAVSQTLRERQREIPTQYGPVVSKVLGKIDIFLAAGDIAVKGAPESVGLAWTGISLALGSVQDDFATFQLFSGACVDIIGILVTCRLFGRMFSQSKGPPELYEIQDQVRIAIPKIYAKILEFSYQMFKYMDRNKFLRMTRGVLKNNKEEFSGAMKDIKEGERIMSENATKASQALTSFWQQKSDDKQNQMLAELKQIRDKLSESTATSKEINDYLQKELEEQRRKSPMDIAREAYAKHKQTLRALVDTEAMLTKRKIAREEGTCQWIFETEAYQRWHDSAGSSILWVSGGGNMGKSVLISSVIERLRTETISNPEEHTMFFFCKSGDDNAQKTERIMDHLVYYLFDLVPMSLEILDRCNDIARQYLAGSNEGRRRRKTMQQDSPEAEKTLNFEEAFQRMAEVLKKKLFLVVDALDECSDRKEEELIQRLAALSKRKDLKIKILLTSRPEVDITEVMDKCDVPEIRMEKFNEGDIFKTVEAQLSMIPGMTSSERITAREQICGRAGPYFGYLKPALELLRRPWQRPIEVHLQALPENLLNMNARIFQNTDPSYIGFLKTCLTWVILANGEQKMKIDELIDIYSQRFTVKSDDSDVENTSQEELSDEVTKFYKNMIRKAGETFLDLDEKTKELNLIKPALVKDSFLKTNEEAERIQQRSPSPDACQCQPCRAMKKQDSNFILTKKYGHLEIATQIFKHLNSPLFQRIYLPSFQVMDQQNATSGSLSFSRASSPKPPENGGEGNDPGPIMEEESLHVRSEMTNKVEENGKVKELSREKDANAATEDSSKDPITYTEMAAHDQMNNADVSTNATSTTSPVLPHKTSPELEELNVEAEASLSTPQVDFEEANLTFEKHEAPDHVSDVMSDADSDVYEPSPSGFAANTDSAPAYPRYEIAQAIYHLQMVEDQWAAEEEKPPEYEALYEDVLKFFDNANEGFLAWKRDEGVRPNTVFSGQFDTYTLTPLHIAAANGLLDLCRRIIEKQKLDYAQCKDKERFRNELLEKTSGGETLNLAPSTALSIDTEPKPAAEDAGKEIRPDGMSPDIFAEMRSAEKYFELHRSETDVNVLSSNMTPLSWACRISDNTKKYNVCKLLLENGALPGVEALRSLNGEMFDGEPPFHSLMYFGAAEPRIVQLFLDHGASVKEKDPWGFNVMHNFAWSGDDPAVLDMLVEAGADVNVRDDVNETPLHKMLSSRGDEMPMNLLKRFLEHNADIFASDRDGQQPLFEVAGGGNVEALKMLLEHEPKPDINHRDVQGWTALHNAANSGHLESCKLLCAAGADPTVVEEKNRTPFYLSCINDDVALTDYLAQLLLIRNSKLLDERSSHGKTTLRKAAALGRTEIVKLLLTKYRSFLDINAADVVLQWTPLHAAAYLGYAEIVEALLENGADTKCKDVKGRIALTLSYQQWELLQSSDGPRNTSFESCILALIEADRDSAIADRNLLSAAARIGSMPVLEALVLAKPGRPRADPFLRDEFGWTAIELARQYKRQIVVDFLQQQSGTTCKYPDHWVITQPDKTRWNSETKELEYTKEVEGIYPWSERVTVFADVPIPANVERYYFEITLAFEDPKKAVERRHLVAIGVFSLGASKWKTRAGLDLAFPGDLETSKRGIQSWAYHGDNGWISTSRVGFYDEVQDRRDPFGHGDTVGCGIDFVKGYVFWTKNGKRLMKQAFNDVNGRLTPAIGLLGKVKITTSFEGPFKWTYGDTLEFDADMPIEQEKTDGNDAEN
ncbi:uncharacterized protein PV09_08150 [Verruconis gallopava]|uniref:B30.2/SPRY domain-containing protein n=1 Tax=Verruconis gallopava TaxID=253628 RepID=A0A0D2A1R2_9PEZI|nr:uncharacterized protein PV09_08150 [Verruconis gallopava]KIW00260.1 hypothetical protein PV09_08150 [Verruconis gallopava]